MSKAFICGTIHTPFGRYGKPLTQIRTDDLAALTIRELEVRNHGRVGAQAQLLAPHYTALTLLHGARRLGLQCLTNLNKFPPTGIVIMTAPPERQGVAGGMSRGLALVPG